jgi:hypothetical protein
MLRLCSPRYLPWTGRAGIGGSPQPSPPHSFIVSASFIPTGQSGSPKKAFATDYFWHIIVR